MRTKFADNYTEYRKKIEGKFSTMYKKIYLSRGIIEPGSSFRNENEVHCRFAFIHETLILSYQGIKRYTRIITERNRYVMSAGFSGRIRKKS